MQKIFYFVLLFILYAISAGTRSENENSSPNRSLNLGAQACSNTLFDQRVQIEEARVQEDNEIKSSYFEYVNRVVTRHSEDIKYCLQFVECDEAYELNDDERIQLFSYCMAHDILEIPD